MPYHLMLDHAGEAKLGKLQIGTTRRGIGPCYADKAARLGIRVQDLLDEKILKQKIVAALEPKRLSLRPFAKDPRLDLQAMTEEYLTYGHGSSRYIADTSRLVLERARRRPDRGVRGRAGRAARHRPRHVSVRDLVESGRRLGVHRRRRRAQGHRRGLGRGQGVRDPGRRRAVPDRDRRELADEIRERGGEYGTTTGRPRRVGWLDLVALRYAARLNSLTALAVTKLDVLSGLDRLARLHALSRRRGRRDSTTSHTTRPCSTTPPASTSSCPGGREDLSECRTEDDLPSRRAGVPAVRRRVRRGADRADRRRPGARRGDLDGGQRGDGRRRCSPAAAWVIYADGRRRRATGPSGASRA